MVSEWLFCMMLLTLSLGDHVLAENCINGDINTNYKETDDFSEDQGISKYAVDDWFSYGMSYTNSILGQGQQCLRTRGHEEGQKVSRGAVFKDESQEKNSKPSKRRLKGSRRKRKKERRKKVSKWIKKKQDKEQNTKWSSPKGVKIKDRKDMKHSYSELEECNNYNNNDQAYAQIKKCRKNSDKSEQDRTYFRRDDDGD